MEVIDDGTKKALEKVDRKAQRETWLFFGIAGLAGSVVGFVNGRKSEAQ